MTSLCYVVLCSNRNFYSIESIIRLVRVLRFTDWWHRWHHSKTGLEIYFMFWNRFREYVSKIVLVLEYIRHQCMIAYAYGAVHILVRSRNSGLFDPFPPLYARLITYVTPCLWNVVRKCKASPLPLLATYLLCAQPTDQIVSIQYLKSVAPHNP